MYHCDAQGDADDGDNDNADDDADDDADDHDTNDDADDADAADADDDAAADDALFGYEEHIQYNSLHSVEHVVFAAVARRNVSVTFEYEGKQIAHHITSSCTLDQLKAQIRAWFSLGPLMDIDMRCGSNEETVSLAQCSRNNNVRMHHYS